MIAIGWIIVGLCLLIGASIVYRQRTRELKSVYKDELRPGGPGSEV